ncbi:MAG: alpha/beta fold hydrolase [Actinobacteria bacterium]|nr:alpha/beta fold hydrolase [Actinomycetota bacterium]MCG2818516.1 alpha/beta fold hydrolase [Actinomycetes bacterium]MBU4218295.1 alpha/beta fold hydrolase [Actinomycetota bacterium]MBU4358720.1 alpha/beta fold hydrolase [Actinomycetota bacterium]MBU4391888.1 alpha/beta fold hydrolase [Actinomycetota bacterium]
MGNPYPKRRAVRAIKASLALLLLVALAPLLVTAVLIVYSGLRYLKHSRTPVAHRPYAGRALDVKTMSDVMESLSAVPFRSLLPGAVAAVVMAAADTIPVLLDSTRVAAGVIYPYPGPFEPVMLHSPDGTPICGLQAIHREPGPAILFVHGLFGSKNTRSIQAMALRAFFSWGFHVFVVDLRNSGDSSRFSDAPTSWGFRESDDVLAVALYLCSLEQVTTVGACGVSMGAASVLLAAGRSRLEGPLAGGVIALNGYADAARAVEYVSTAPGLSIERFTTWLVFRLLLLLKTVARGPRPMCDLRTYTREVSSQYYEISDSDLYRKASPIKAVGEIEVPCLIVHSTDDPVVPIGEAEDLIAAAIDNPMVGSLITPSGGHALYPATSNRWFYTILEMFFSYWGEFSEGVESGQASTNRIEMFGNSEN